MLAKLTGARVYLKLDSNSSFYQIPLLLESILLTTFTIPYGSFCYTRLRLGIKSASEVYKIINDILHDLNGDLYIIDDVLVFGKDKTEHDARLHAVLNRFHATNIIEKCDFKKSCIKIAGHVLSGNDISPDPDRLTAVLNMAHPTNVYGVHYFL